MAGAVFAAGSVLGPAGAPAAAQTKPVARPGATTTTLPTTPPASKAWVLLDVDNGRVLAEQNEHQPLPPASLTKVLTAQIASSWLPPDDQVPVSARAAAVYPDRVGMKAGQVWPLDIAVHALLISSANDAAYALAEHVSGTVEAFGPVMATAATQLGMSDSPVWRDPAGLDGTEGVGGGNLVSARDIAIAGRDLLADPTLAQIVALDTFTFTGPDGVVYKLTSHNHAFLASYAGAIGIKTGFTDPAGLCIMAAATRNGRTMMAVVLNGANPTLTASMLLDQGFAMPVAAEPVNDVLPPVEHPYLVASPLVPVWPAQLVATPPLTIPHLAGPTPAGQTPAGPTRAGQTPAGPTPAGRGDAAVVPIVARSARGGQPGHLVTPHRVELAAIAVLLGGIVVGRRARSRLRAPLAHGARRSSL